MENATKALLIAAAILIAIVLIALGVGLLNSTGDTTDDAKNVANALESSTSTAANGVVGELTGMFPSEDEE